MSNTFAQTLSKSSIHWIPSPGKGFVWHFLIVLTLSYKSVAWSPSIICCMHYLINLCQWRLTKILLSDKTYSLTNERTNIVSNMCPNNIRFVRHVPLSDNDKNQAYKKRLWDINLPRESQKETFYPAKQSLERVSKHLSTLVDRSLSLSQSLCSSLYFYSFWLVLLGQLSVFITHW